MRSVRKFDLRWSKAIQHMPKSIRQLMFSVSFLGEPLVVLAAALAGFTSASIRNRESIQKAFVYAAIAFAINTALKYVLKRGRPNHLDLRTFGIKSYSFPSGHAFGSVIFYGLFSYLDLKYLSYPVNVLVFLSLWSLIIAIGLSRIYLKAHYPSDVAGGWLLGLVSLVVVISLAF